MKRLLVLLLLGFTGSLAQDAPQSTAGLAWKHVSPRYASLDDIKPVLVNDGKQSVFLSRIYPDGYAQLERFNAATEEWERGQWGMRCGTVSHPDVPIEIQTKTEQSIQVYWQLSTDHSDNPRFFVVEMSREKRQLEGKYRLMLRYAMKPWTVFEHPDAIYEIVSPEFLVTR